MIFECHSVVQCGWVVISSIWMKYEVPLTSCLKEKWGKGQSECFGGRGFMGRWQSSNGPQVRLQFCLPSIRLLLSCQTSYLIPFKGKVSLPDLFSPYLLWGSMGINPVDLGDLLRQGSEVNQRYRGGRAPEKVLLLFSLFIFICLATWIHPKWPVLVCVA